MELNYHKLLGNYFFGKPLYLDEPTRKKPNTRKLVEQPWQQTRAEMWDEVTDTLCNLEFIQAKVSTKMIFDLVTDFNSILQLTPAKDVCKSPINYERNIEQLDVFSKTLVREKDNLVNHPHLTWQQFYNRLRFYKGLSNETIINELVRYALEGITPWIELKAPLRESAGLVTMFQAHDGMIWDCIISPDGKLFASVGHDGIIRVWSLDSYREISKLYHDEFNNNKWIGPFRTSLHNNHPDSPEWVDDIIDGIREGANKVTECVFDARSRKLAVKLGSETIVVFDVHSGNECWIADNLPSFLKQTKISTDGVIEMCSSTTRLAVDLVRDILLVPRTDHFEAIDINDGKLLGRWQIRTAGIAVHNISGTIVVAEVIPPGRIFALDPKTGDNALLFQDGTEGISSCAVVPGFPFIIIGEKKGQVTVFDGSTHARISQSQAHNYAVKLCLVSSDGRYLVTSDGRSLKLWSLPLLEEYKSFSDFVTPVVFSPDSRYIVGTSLVRNNDLVVWDLDIASEKTRLIGHTGKIKCCAFSPDGNYIISGDEAGSVRVWELLNSKAEIIPSIHSDFIRTINFSSDGNSLATADDSGLIQLWDANSLEQKKSYSASKNTKWAIGPDGTKLISVTKGLVTLLDATTGKVIASLPTPMVDSLTSTRCCISPDGLLAAVRAGKKMLIWDLRTMKAVEVNDDLFGFTCDCTYTANAHWILTSEVSHISIRSANQGAGRGRIRDKGYQPKEITSFAVSPADDFVVTGDNEGRIRVWDWPPDSMTYTGFVGDLLPRWEKICDRSKIISCCVGISGRVIAVASSIGKIYIWDAMKGIELGVLPLSGVSCVALHPLNPVLVLGTFSGDIYFAYLHHFQSIIHPKIIAPPDLPFQIHFERPQPIRVVIDAPKPDPVEWEQRMLAAEDGWKPIPNIIKDMKQEKCTLIDFNPYFNSVDIISQKVKTRKDNDSSMNSVSGQEMEISKIDESNHNEIVESVFVEAQKAFSDEQWYEAFTLYSKLIKAGKFDESELLYKMALCRINMLTDNKPKMVENITVLIRLLKDKGKHKEVEIISTKLRDRLLYIKSNQNWWSRMFK